MIYFDTDVLVHFVVTQDDVKHAIPKKTTKQSKNPIMRKSYT